MKTIFLISALTLLVACGKDKGGSSSNNADGTVSALMNKGVEFQQTGYGYQISCRYVGNVTNQSRINSLNSLIQTISSNMGTVQIEMGNGVYIDPNRMLNLLSQAVQTLQYSNQNYGYGNQYMNQNQYGNTNGGIQFGYGYNVNYGNQNYNNNGYYNGYNNNNNYNQNYNQNQNTQCPSQVLAQG